AIAMFLSVVILGRFTTETHAMALYISTDTPPLFTHAPARSPLG
ncbi:acyl-CoA thioesterase, partial [Mycobacterium avium subsp. paratuberculosis S5]